MTKGSRLVATVLVIVLVGIVTMLALARWLLPEFGPGYDPTSPAHLARLRSVAASAAPLIGAIKEFRRANGRLPNDLNELQQAVADLDAAGRFDPEADGKAPWSYTLDGETAFLLACKLGWDPELLFVWNESSGGSWFYAPGDGTNGTPLPQLDTSPHP